jgi:hypothetical protein
MRNKGEGTPLKATLRETIPWNRDVLKSTKEGLTASIGFLWLRILSVSREKRGKAGG